jgi:hypothetical protein
VGEGGGGGGGGVDWGPKVNNKIYRLLVLSQTEHES